MENIGQLLLTLTSLLTSSPGNVDQLEGLPYQQRLLPPFREFVGPLAPNKLMSDAVRLHEGKLAGPESIAEFNGQLYTGTADGWIWRVSDTDATKLTQIKRGHCFESHYTKAGCGRPLGLRFDSKGVLYIVDAIFGLYSYDIEADNLTLILSNEQTAPLGQASVFLDDLDIVEEDYGNVYFISDVSTRYGIHEVAGSLFGPDKGRLICYCEKYGLSSLVEDLDFPNGVQLTDDKTAVLVSETTGNRVRKHFIKGPRENQTEVFVDNLPGMPDNIRRSASVEETYWVSLAVGRNGTQPNLIDLLNQKPALAKLLTVALGYIGKALELLGEVADMESLQKLGYNLKTRSFLFQEMVKSAYGLLVEVDKDGNIINSVHSPDGALVATSEVLEVTKPGDARRTLYVASYSNPFLAKIEIDF